MPKWMNDPPDEPRGPSFPIIRTPPARPLDAIVTSDDLIGCYTHFWHGSTHPCQAPDCQPCNEGMPFRWHAYLTAVGLQTNLHFIFECTAISATSFTAYRNQMGTLRGCQFRAKRWNNKPNGRILIQTRQADLTERTLPTAPDLKKCMAILWSLPLDDVTTPDRNPETDMPRAAIRPSKHHQTENVSYVRSNSPPSPEQPVTPTPKDKPR